MHLIFFGASQMGRQALKIVQALNHHVIAFCDNDYKKWGDILENTPIISPDEAIKSNVKILITSEYKYEIAKQLEKNNIYDYILDINILLIKLRNEQRIKISKIIDSLDNCKLSAYYDIDESVIEDSSPDEILFLSPAYPLSGGGSPADSFLSVRVKSYIKYGNKVSVFCYLKNAGFKKENAHGTIIYSGDGHCLEALLRRNTYKKILIHFIYEGILFHINHARPDIKVIIWIHAIEAMKWRRNQYNYTAEHIKKFSETYDKDDKRNMHFLKTIYENPNYTFVFVSEWIKKIAMEDANANVCNHQIIHNYINSDFFKYKPKVPEDRFKILKIKSFGEKWYANDLACKTILELSKRDIFSKLSFELYGDGELFDEEMKELIQYNFDNVHIFRRYLSHEDIRKAHGRNGIFLCPTRQDSQGVSMGEAMASGLVVVTNSVAAIPEFIDENTGMLCENENYIQMADSIEFLYMNPDTFLKLSKNASERVNAQCSFDQTIKREIDIIGQSAN